jgi:hypothetical protein
MVLYPAPLLLLQPRLKLWNSSVLLLFFVK